MKQRERLTDRQMIFAEHFALTGNGTQAAIRAGCRNPNSAHVRANRWLQKAAIQERIQELREEAFGELRTRVTRSLSGSVLLGLRTGINYKEVRRACTMIKRLGVYRYQTEIENEIERLETKYKVPFELILDAVLEAKFATEIK